jgi:ABC-2 type transport system permease protein
MTPMIMVLRLAASPDIPLFQIIASFALLIVSLPLVIALSAKIFRTGILIYGKQPTPREILKWVRYK